MPLGRVESLVVRPETRNDYAAIADVHIHAFGNRTNESLIVALLRQRADYDPELSLVAEIGGRIVGHAFFSPHTVRLLGQNVRAVNLAPLGVDPARQKEGIGSRLMEEGHRIAAAKGYGLSFLLGHPSYYPRFGYRTHAFGSSEVTVRVDSLQAETLDERVPAAADVPSLSALWRLAEAEVDFSLEPGPLLADWISPNPSIEARVYLQGNEIVGYTRIHSADPARPRIFLVRDGETGQAVAATIAQHFHLETAQVTLPLHQYSSSASGFRKPTYQSWEAAMAVALGDAPLEEYLTLVDSDERCAGRPIWPVAFDFET